MMMILERLKKALAWMVLYWDLACAAAFSVAFFAAMIGVFLYTLIATPQVFLVILGMAVGSFLIMITVEYVNKHVLKPTSEKAKRWARASLNLPVNDDIDFSGYDFYRPSVDDVWLIVSAHGATAGPTNRAQAERCKSTLEAAWGKCEIVHKDALGEPDYILNDVK